MNRMEQSFHTVVRRCWRTSVLIQMITHSDNGIHRTAFLLYHRRSAAASVLLVSLCVLIVTFDRFINCPKQEGVRRFTHSFGVFNNMGFLPFRNSELEFIQFFLMIFFACCKLSRRLRHETHHSHKEIQQPYILL